MGESSDEVIDRCAKAVDEIALELEVLVARGDRRTGQYDRQTKLQMTTALSWVKRASAAVKALRGTTPKEKSMTKIDMAEARDILTEIRSAIVPSRSSIWETTIALRIDRLLSSGRSSEPS